MATTTPPGPLRRRPGGPAGRRPRPGSRLDGPIPANAAEGTTALGGRLTERDLRLIIGVSRFVVFLALTLMLLWVTPLASTIDDEFRLETEAPNLGGSPGGSTPPEARAKTTALAAPGPEEGPADPTAPDASEGDSSNHSGAGEAGAGSGDGGAGGGPDGGTGGGASGGPGGSSAEATAARWVETLVASFNPAEASSLTSSDKACLAGALVESFTAGKIEALGAASSLAELPEQTRSELMPLLERCFPVTTMLYDALVAGQTPTDVARCMAPLMAEQVGWDELMAIQVDPEDPAANERLGDAAASAAESCYQG